MGISRASSRLIVSAIYLYVNETRKGGGFIARSDEPECNGVY